MSKSRRIAVLVLTTTLVFAVGGWVLAHEHAAQRGGGMPMEQGMVGGGMVGGGMVGPVGMMGHGGMMAHCVPLVGGPAAALPQLPPGNEKLQFQMHAEMMQVIGEIATRYAERIRESR